jgi:hypothetical protein
MYSSPAAWAAWVVKRPPLVLPLTALVIGIWAPVLLAGTGELAVKPVSVSAVSPEVDPEQSPTGGGLVVPAGEDTRNWLIDHQELGSGVVSTTSTNWAVCVVKVAVSGLPLP